MYESSYQILLDPTLLFLSFFNPPPPHPTHPPMPSTKSKRRSRRGVEQDDTVATSGVYHCLGHRCDREYNTLHSIKRHIRNKHLQHSIFVCLEGAEKCDYHTDRRDAHFKHLHEAHPGKYEYECETGGCQKAFPTLQALQEHLPCFPYECRLDECTLNFPHYRSRESHQREAHPHIDLVRHQVDTYVGLGPRPTAISVILPPSASPPQLATSYIRSSFTHSENNFSQESSAVSLATSSADGGLPGSNLSVSSDELLYGSSIGPSASGVDRETSTVDSETIRSETPIGTGHGSAVSSACGLDEHTSMVDSETIRSETPLGAGSGFGESLSSSSQWRFGGEDMVGLSSGPSVVAAEVHNVNDAIRYVRPGVFEFRVRHVVAAPDHQPIHKETLVFKEDAYLNAKEGVVMTPDNSEMAAEPRYWLDGNIKTPFRRQDHLPLMRAHYKIPDDADTLEWLRKLMDREDCPFSIPPRDCTVCQRALTPENCDLIVSKDPFRPLMYFYSCQGCLRSKGIKRRSGFEGFSAGWASNKWRGFGSVINARATALMLAFQPAVMGSLEFTEGELSVLIERSRNARLACFYTGRPLSFELPRSQAHSLSIDRTTFVEGRSLPYWHKDQVIVSTGRFLNCFFEDLTMEERLCIFDDLDLHWDQRKSDGDEALCRVERLWRDHEQEPDTWAKSDDIMEMEKDSKVDDDYKDYNDDYKDYNNDYKDYNNDYNYNYDDDDDDDDWLRVRGKNINWQERYRAFCDGKKPGRVK
ncbi:hypothetical protein BGZ90_007134 [Linnemannia elongata]|nr:hypothetical protein BGZ90_007134 [Linnemannia elongata]